MSAPHELTLEHPIELDGNRYDRLKIAGYSAIADFEGHNAPRVILSLAKAYGVPRRVVRHLDPTDASRAGDMLRDLLDDFTNSIR
jgi:hypothetical protein